MAQAIKLDKEVETNITKIGEAEIVVGIPSYNNVHTIGHVVRAVGAGLAKYFGGRRAVLVNSDGGSADGTREAVLAAEMEDLEAILLARPITDFHKVVTAYHGIPGKGSALRTIFAIAAKLNARACLVVDADLRSITLEWVQLLVAPVLERGYDFVSPLYRRHKYDGTITNSIIYPLVRALYGYRVRQPIGGDFGFSGRLAQHYLSQDVWDSEVARYGIDVWMTTSAVTGGYKVCQAFLGAKIHDPKDPGADLSGMLVQVVCSLFSVVDTTFDLWSSVRGSEAVPTFGFQFEVGVEPVFVNLERMVNGFKLGVKELMPVWSKALDPGTAEALAPIARQGPESFSFPEELWVRVVYDYAAAFHGRVMNREHLIKSMVPLYLGWTASFVREMATASPAEVDERLERLCLVFEAMKPYLIEKWR